MFKYTYTLLILSYVMVAIEYCSVSLRVGIGLMFFAVGTGVLLWK